MNPILFLYLLTLGDVLSIPLKITGYKTNSTMESKKINTTNNILAYSNEGYNNITQIKIDKDFNVTSTAENNSLHMQRDTSSSRKDKELCE